MNGLNVSQLMSVLVAVREKISKLEDDLDSASTKERETTINEEIDEYENIETIIQKQVGI